MTYEDFKSELYRIIMQQEEVKDKKIMLLETGFTTKNRQMLEMIRYINKLNYGKEEDTVQADLIHVLWGKGNVKSMMYWSIREYYSKFKQEGWEGILPELLTKIQNAGHNMDWLHLDRDGYEYCKDRLIIRPINYENNQYELENCIFKRHGDIALTLYGIVSDEEEDYVTMKITRNLVENWDISENRMFQNALLNTCALMPPRLYFCSDLRKKHSWEEGIFMESSGADTEFCIHPENELEGTLGYRLSTTKNINGAVALFYPGVQKRLGELLEGDYLVGFTSIHEAIIHPVNCQDPENMKESIRDINDVFPKEEMLTNSIFRYNVKSEMLAEV